jgi:diguanylate cyclase (GGDEF)-like protein
MQHLWLKLSLEHKLAVLISSSFVVLASVAIYLSYFESKQAYENKLRHYGELIVNQIEQHRLSSMEQGAGHSFIQKSISALTSQKAYKINDISFNQIDGIFRFISAHPLNPENQPDEIERRALTSFEQGEKDYYLTVNLRGEAHLRYVQPLMMKTACLACHGSATHQVGDLRGGISITIPVEQEHQAFHQSLMKEVLYRIIIFIVLFILITLYVRTLLISPLNKLSALSERIGSGHLQEQDWESHDQMSELYNALVIADKRIKKQQDELVRLAELADMDSRIDPLTGIYNRRHLSAEGTKLFEQAKRNQAPISTVMIDIDHFKNVNDTYGHAIGDEVIKHLCACINTIVRTYDLFVRLGGEEFLLILPTTDAKASHAIAERIRLMYESMPLKLNDGSDLKSTISLGVCCSMNQGLDQAIECADAQLYVAKNNGRNQTVVFDSSTEA